MSDSGGGGISKIDIALIIIFSIALVALFANLFYVFWRRRVFRRQNPTAFQGGGGGGDQQSQYSSDRSVSSAASSKELLYFLCIRPRAANSDITNTHAPPQVEVVDIDLLALQGMYGPSRFLFTIKEEEKEDHNQSEAGSLEEGFVNYGAEDSVPVAEQEVVVLVVTATAEEEEEVDNHVGGTDATPFSTPCASPVYFTPPASPVHDLLNTRTATLTS